MSQNNELTPEEELERVQEETTKLKVELAKAEQEKLRRELAEIQTEKESTPVDLESGEVELPTTRTEAEEEVVKTPSRVNKFTNYSAWLAWQKAVALVVLIVIIPVSLGAFLHFQVIPRFSDSPKFGTELVPGDVRATNSEMVVFEGQVLENANINQKALATNGTATNPPGIVFGNGSLAPKKVEIYIDVNAQASRNFVLMNSESLQYMVESGAIELTVRPFVGSTVFSMYGAEALMEAATLSPENTWEYFIGVLKLSASAQEKELKQDEIAQALGKLATKTDIDGIDQESIQNGTFSSWLLSLGNDPNLGKMSVPGLVINGSVVDTQDVNLNDADAVSGLIGHTN